MPANAEYSQVAKLVIYLLFSFSVAAATTDIDRNSTAPKTYAPEPVAMIFPLFMFRVPSPRWYRYTSTSARIKCDCAHCTLSAWEATAQLTHVWPLLQRRCCCRCSDTYYSDGEPIWNEIDNRNYCHHRVSNVRSQSYPNWIVGWKKLNEVTALQWQATGKNTPSLYKLIIDTTQNWHAKRHCSLAWNPIWRWMSDVSLVECLILCAQNLAKRWIYLAECELPIEIIHSAHSPISVEVVLVIVLLSEF